MPRQENLQIWQCGLILTGLNSRSIPYPWPLVHPSFAQHRTAARWPTAITALAIQHGIMPPTINYENQDEGMDLDYVPNAARKKDLTYAMSNSFGFGGTNASVILKKYTE